MISSSVKGQIRRYIVDTFLDGKERDFSDETNLFETGILNSIAAVELLLFLEDAFGERVAFGRIDLEDLESVDAICHVIEEVQRKPA